MTRKITLLLPLALAVSASPQTPKKTPVAGTGATVQALIALEDKWVDALQKADTETLNSILADTYVDTDEQGQQSDKQGILSALKSADLKFESLKVSDMQARTYDAAAVVTGTGVQRGTFKRQPLTPQVVFTDTFIRQNGNWRAVASHRATAPAEGGPSPVSAEPYIRDREAQWAEAVANGDPSVVQRILADDYIGVDAGDGHLYDKAEAISFIREHHSEFVSNRLNEVKIRFFGNTAVAQGSESWERRMGDPRLGRFVWTDTWLLRNGRWQIVAGEDMIAPPLPANKASASNEPHTVTASNEAEIKALYDRWAQALQARDIDGMMSVYAPGDALVAYDIVPPLQYKGKDAYRKDYLDFLAHYDGPMHVEYRDMGILSSGDVGVIHALERLSGKLTNGQQSDLWLRVTSALRKIDGKWFIVHDHVSVPVDFETGKAALQLKP